MAIARIKVWVANEVLTASDLNAEFNNILDNPVSLISPLTGALNFNGNQATNLRFETQSATQSAAAEGVVYWHTGEDSLHISTGTLQARVPALTSLVQGRLIGTSPTATDGATSYAQILLGSGLSLSDSTLSSSVTVPAASGFSQVQGLVGHTTTTTLLASAYTIMARDNNRAITMHDSTGTLTLDSGASGLNGRDQAGAFSASQDLHAYFISDGTTVATVLADSAPPTGPDLNTLGAFSGYIYWAYIGSYYWNSSSQFIPARLTGSWVMYEATQTAGTNLASQSEAAVSVSTFVPAIARRWKARVIAEKSANDDSTTLILRVVTGQNYFSWNNTGSGFSGWRLTSEQEFPNIGQRLFYIWAADPGSQRDFEFSVLGYNTSNGDS